jgi:hypothetical protein
MGDGGDRLIDQPGFWDSYSHCELAPPEFLRRFAERAVGVADEVLQTLSHPFGRRSGA